MTNRKSTKAFQWVCDEQPQQRACIALPLTTLYKYTRRKRIFAVFRAYRKRDWWLPMSSYFC